MSAQIYVENLSFNTTFRDLKIMFVQSGTVQSISLIEHRETGCSRGFAFVEMSSKEEAQSALSSFNGKEIDGRALTVNGAKPREERASNHRMYIGRRSNNNRGGNYPQPHQPLGSRIK